MVLLRSNAARSCAVRTMNEFHPGLVLPPRAEPPAPRVPQSEDRVTAAYDAIAAGDGRVVDLRGLFTDPDARRTACMQAMADGADVIIAGMLHSVDHRSGRPNLLVRDPEGGYVPGLVRGFKLLDRRKDGSVARISRLEALGSPDDVPGFRYRWQYRWRYALQLAHYYRMLDSLGQAPRSGAYGIVVGVDEVDAFSQPAVWLRLDEPTVGLAGGQVPEEDHDTTSPLTRYDIEFARRLAIAEQAAAAGPLDPPALSPIYSSECEICAWKGVCLDRLDPDDLSLRISKSPLDVHEIAVLREAGVLTVNDLASADLDELMPGYLDRITHRRGAEDRLRLAQRRSQLVLDGITLERTGSGPVDVPGAPLEIDLDIETSSDGRAYLWGFWVDEPDGQHYEQFSEFRSLDDRDELALAHRALDWLRHRVEGTDARVYHYSDYELRKIDGLAARGDSVLSWAKEYARSRFVDLFPIVRQQFFGTNGLGLKVVASAGAGFSWRDPDPGGLNSMRWFSDAVSGESAQAREHARTRVLEYNEDDVRATWAVRRWLRSL